MATPTHPHLFPDDAGADLFVREFPSTVAPGDRDRLIGRLMIVLRVPEPGAPTDAAGPEYRDRIRRVLGALETSLEAQGNGKLAPYARLRSEDHPDSDSLAEAAGKGFGFSIPRNMTPDRFPEFALLSEMIRYIRDRPGRWPGPVAKELRDHAYEKRALRGGLPALLWSLSGGGPPALDGLKGFLIGTCWHGLTVTFPRWWWARRQTARLIRPGFFSFRRGARWLGAELNVATGREGLFEVLDEVAARQAPRLALPDDHANHIEALDTFDEVLVRALLEDLRTPLPGGMLPKRRRRRARPVLLVELPREGTQGSRAAERLMRALHTVTGTENRNVSTDGVEKWPGLLVVAAGTPSDALLAALDAEECGLARAADRMREGSGRPVLVHLEDEPFSREGLPIRRVNPKLFRLHWKAVTALVTVGALVALAAGAYATRPQWLPAADPTCAGGDPAAGQPGGHPEGKPGDLYQEAYREIQKQNQVAEKFARSGRTVRTIVHFSSDRPTNDRTRTVLYDGTIPELRGIALWQRRLNREAVSDDSRVPLRVEVRSTGMGFENAPAEARKLVEELKGQPDAPGHEEYKEVIGVLGFAQSKKETREAVRILQDQEIPVVGTIANSDQMLVSRTYWPFTPLNSTQAEIMAGFASLSPVVARPGGERGCTPAEHAIVVRTPTDLYSKELADLFRDRFPGTADLIDFSQDDDRSQPVGSAPITVPGDLAERVCRELKDHPESVVLWAARARDFTAFVNAFDKRDCSGRGLTVLGGDELTNVSQSGEFDDDTWLRLYYSAHRLPGTDPRASKETKDFIRDYDDWVNGPAARDAFRHDSNSAVSYDAFRMLSQGVDQAAKWTLSRAGVRAVLGTGVTFEGATGSVNKPLADNLPPADKTLVILRTSPEGPAVVAACGAYRPGETYSEQGPPCPK